jgi:hypothetical protein
VVDPTTDLPAEASNETRADVAQMTRMVGRALVTQLVSWQPRLPKGVKTDTVMALWFAELRCQELIASAEGGTHTRSIFQTRFDRASQRAVSWDEYETDQAATAAGSWWR